VAEERFPRYEEFSILIRAPIDTVFAFLDDPMALAAHMRKSSMRMMGSRMAVEVDAGGGQALDSKVALHGKILGIPVSLEEAITERHEPYRKCWETIGTPRLLVIAHYRMGFELTPKDDATLTRVFIHYSLPVTPPGSWLGSLFGAFYARWCTKTVGTDAAKHFNATTTN